MQRDDVGIAEYVVHPGAITDAQRLGLARCERARPGDDFQAESLRAGDDFAADRADADHAEGFAENPVGLGEFLFVPLVGPQRGGAVGDAAVHAQHQGENQFRHGDGILAGAVGDEDAQRTGGFDIDGVDARAGAQDEREFVAGPEGLGSDLFAADDEDFVPANELGADPRR